MVGNLAKYYYFVVVVAIVVVEVSDYVLLLPLLATNFVTFDLIALLLVPLRILLVHQYPHPRNCGSFHPRKLYYF